MWVCRGHARDATSSHAPVVCGHRIGRCGWVQQGVGNASGLVACAAGGLCVALYHGLLSLHEIALKLLLECNRLRVLCSQEGDVSAPGMVHAEWHALWATPPQRKLSELGLTFELMMPQVAHAKLGLLLAAHATVQTATEGPMGGQQGPAHRDPVCLGP